MGSRAPAIKASKGDKKEKLVLRFTLPRERTHNRHLMYCIVPLSLIVIVLLAYTFVQMDDVVAVASIRDLHVLLFSR